MSRKHSKSRDRSSNTVPITRAQCLAPAPAEHIQSGENQSVVLISSNGTKLSPNRLGSDSLNVILFISAGAFLMLGFTARYLDGKSVKSTSWGLHLVQASQLVISHPIFS